MTAILVRASSGLLAVAAVAACSDKGGDPMQQYGPDPVLPEPHQYLVPPMSVPLAVGWKPGETPTVPAGLRIQAMATGLMHPRIVYPLPNGDILVVESNSPGSKPYRPKDYIQGPIKARAGAGDEGGNRITLLRDASGDGVPISRSVLIDKLNSPYGVAWVAGTLYVANTDGILAFPFALGETKITAPGVKLADLPAGPINHHWTKSMVASPDGSKLYVGVGSNSNITENGFDVEEGRAAIYEVDRATGAQRIFASGTRNPTNLAIQPGTGQLFAVVNERDEIGPDLVPDYLTSIKEGGFYGWPYSYWGQHVDVHVHPQRPDMIAKAITPDYALSSHVAALGVVFSQGETLSAQFANGAFVGEHGSWDRDPLNGYQVIFVPFVNNKPYGNPIPVVTNFLAADHKTVHGRPVGVALDRTGALIVSDDVGNTVWRVSSLQR
ncbi:PQQ-dependent sugar dehydrogenase [Pseudaminobacter soli (ex Li et al. 2025)]|uniref:L-sorbosone dehydrogenase n=1 Tax=Pseudaminobacter soli (ex Li et al. 2025) TaxID=1295366 RepID=A0A2P7S188_9HYPH|nr:sorbosone dehydrogenase family protein [Mesorhizobium soli]PSJ56203.1 L-sorbosone dehydrogenase [Mesorhizobium soli]